MQAMFGIHHETSSAPGVLPPTYRMTGSSPGSPGITCESTSVPPPFTQAISGAALARWNCSPKR